MNEDISEQEPARELSVRAVLVPGVSAELTLPIRRDADDVRQRLKRQMAAQAGRPHDDIEAAFVALIAEATLEGMNALRRARIWSRLFYVLGLPAAVLAAVAGVTALASTAGRVAAGIIALVAAALSAVVTTLDIETRRRSSEALAAGWQGLAERGRLKVIELRRQANWTETDASLVALVELNSVRDSLRRGVVPDTP